MSKETQPTCIIEKRSQLKAPICCPIGLGVREIRREIAEAESLLGSDIDELVRNEIAFKRSVLESSALACPLLNPVSQVLESIVIEEAPIKPTSPLKKGMTAKDVISYAGERNIQAVPKNGRHGWHLVAPTGSRMPLPYHGSKDLASGTLRSILKWIHLQENAVT